MKKKISYETPGFREFEIAVEHGFQASLTTGNDGDDWGIDYGEDGGEL